MNLETFRQWALSQNSVAKYNDGQFRGECVSLINQYCYRVLGVPASAWGHAKDWATNGNVAQYFDKVGNIQAGDIIVYPGSFGNGYGHIAIALGNGQMLDQNGAGNGRVAVRPIWSGYSAILRRKGTSNNQPPKGEQNMTPDEERLAYNIVLGRQPEPGAQLGRRTALNFIRDAEGELSAQRAEARANVETIKNLKAQVDSLSARPTKEELQAVVDKLKEAEVAKTEDTVLLDEAGSWLSKLWNRLFNKNK